MVGKNITLRGYNLYASVADWGRGMEEMLGWVTSGKLKISTQMFPLADAAKAHEAISARQTTGKVVLVPCNTYPGSFLATPPATGRVRDFEQAFRVHFLPFPLREGWRGTSRGR